MLAECLAGIRVLDLTQYIPGPFATQWLTDLGAEVVKVEPPSGDPMRKMGPCDSDGTTPFYKLANRNKRVVTLDLKDPEGQRKFALMVGRADVLLQAYRPGVMTRLGFGPERLAELNPKLIHCALSGYGQTGPHARAAGHDLTYMALTGGLWASGTAERPVMTFPPLADHAGAQAVMSAILAALFRRERTGKGATLDVSLSEAALAWMGGVLTMGRKFGNPPRETDIITGGAACYRIYRTRDRRFVALAALEEKFWQAFCNTVGHSEWIHRHVDPMPQNELIADLEMLFATRTRDEWVELLAPVDCCFEPVLEPSEVPDHPQWRQRDLIQDAGDGTLEVLFPMLLDGARAMARGPFRDAAAEEVLASWR